MSRLLELDEPPTAVFCASDLMALGAIRAVAQRGLQVPRDVSVVGFDDVLFASILMLLFVAFMRHEEQQEARIDRELDARDAAQTS